VTLYEKSTVTLTRDIVPVARINQDSFVLLVNPSFPAKTVREFIDYARANPGKINLASAGTGNLTHLCGELLRMMTGIDLVHVPYRGTAPMLAAIVAGEVQMIADVMTTSLPHIESGKLRPLAIAGPERSPKLPDVPTTPEIGYRDLQAPFWLGVVAPGGTLPAIIDKLNAALRESLAPPQTRALLAKLGAEIRIGTPAEFGKLLSDELSKWTAVVKAANIRVD